MNHMTYLLLPLALSGSFVAARGHTNPSVTRASNDLQAVETSGVINAEVAVTPTASNQTTDVPASDKPAATVLSSKTSVRGEGALGKPRFGYLWSPELAQVSLRYINQSGWNHSPSSNEGRTGVAAARILVEQNGNGDAGAYYANCQIGGKGRIGATHWLAQPACVLLNGDVATTVPHSYLNVQEFSLSDNGRDVAGIGTVYRFKRTENAAAQGEVWFGVRNQSIGSKAVDVGVSNAGAMNIGMDTVLAKADSEFGTGAVVALNMAADQRIVYNSRSDAMNGIRWYGNEIGSAYDGYSSSLNALVRCNGSACLQVEPQAVTLAGAGLRLSLVRTAELPPCIKAAEGTLYGVTDAQDSTFNARLSGGGDGRVMAYCNGSQWTVH